MRKTHTLSWLVDSSSDSDNVLRGGERDEGVEGTDAFGERDIGRDDVDASDDAEGCEASESAK